MLRSLQMVAWLHGCVFHLWFPCWGHLKNCAVSQARRASSGNSQAATSRRPSVRGRVICLLYLLSRGESPVLQIDDVNWRCRMSGGRSACSRAAAGSITPYIGQSLISCCSGESGRRACLIDSIFLCCALACKRPILQEYTLFCIEKTRI
jgi:hypothetical protein